MLYLKLEYETQSETETWIQSQIHFCKHLYLKLENEAQSETENGIQSQIHCRPNILILKLKPLHKHVSNQTETETCWNRS